MALIDEDNASDANVDPNSVPVEEDDEGVPGGRVKFHDTKIGSYLMVAKRENIMSGKSNWVPEMDKV